MKAWIAASLTLSLASSMGLFFYLRLILPVQIRRRIRRSVECFANAIEARFGNHAGLTQRVVNLSLAIGKELGLKESQLLNLEIAGRIRDIGLCAIPYRLVNERSKSSWTSVEFAQYFEHSKIGAAMLAETCTLSHLTEIVENHHADFRVEESGQLIPLESRILCLASEYIWLEMTRGELLAKDSVRSRSGSRFDPAVVRAWAQVLTSTCVCERASQPISVA